MKENADKARALDAAELDKQLREGVEQMFRLRFQMSMGQMEGMKKYRSLRKERARMLTVIQERETGHEKPVAPAVASAAAPVTKRAKPVAAKPEAKPVVKAAAAAKKPAVRKTPVAPRAPAKPAAAMKPRKQGSKG